MEYKTVNSDIIDKIRAGTLAEDERQTVLVGANLSLLDLSYTNLSEFNLEGASLFKTNLQNSQLYGINLVNADCTGADFSGADLTEAKLVGAGLGQCNFSDSTIFSANLSSSMLTKAKFSNADVRSSVLNKARLYEADLTNADFTDCDMVETDLRKTNVLNAEFRGADMRDARLHGLVGFGKAGWIGVDIREVNFAGAYLVRREIADQNYLDEFRNQSPIHEKIYWIWLKTSDCGRSVRRLGTIVLIQLCIYALIYNFVNIDFGDARTWYSPLYHSIVTMTTLGYGDTLPKSAIAQIVVTTQALLGYVMLGAMLAILSNKIARRAD